MTLPRGSSVSSSLAKLIEAEAMRIIQRERWPLPPDLSDEVVAHEYRLVQAEAILNLMGKGVLRWGSDGSVELAQDAS